MDKKSLSRRANRIQNEKIELENELLEEDDEALEEFEEEDIVEQEQIDDEDDSVEDSMDDFRAMPKVQIDAEVPTSGGKNSHKTNNHDLFKWIIVCIICIVLGIVGYGGYKGFSFHQTHRIRFLMLILVSMKIKKRQLIQICRHLLLWDS